MSRFILKGNFEDELVSSSNNGNTVEADVPFLKDGNLMYGIGRVASKFSRNDIFPSELGYDIMILATMVYMADTRICRELHGQDSWTREIELIVPVSNLDLWTHQIDTLNRMLKFLTGDLWKITFVARTCSLSNETDCEKTDKFSRVTLFSGGMDSLISTINFMESGEDTLLISHAGDGLTKNAQGNIIRKLDEKYPNTLHEWMDLWMVFKNDYIPEGGNDTNTRSRSFLFIAFGMFALTGMTGVDQLTVPENGLIALNVPLEMTRVGSYSTRTTHPFYLSLWNELLAGLGLNLSVANPYWNKTKGEMASECRNKDALFDMMRLSFSCSSPLKARWKSLPPQHCGYCVPCLIRRAAMNKAFGCDNTDYMITDVGDLIRNHAKDRGIQLRSFQYAIKKVKENPGIEKFYIHKTGPLSDNEEYLNELADTYKRGLMEVDDFVSDFQAERIEV